MTPEKFNTIDITEISEKKSEIKDINLDNIIVVKGNEGEFFLVNKADNKKLFKLKTVDKSILAGKSLKEYYESELIKEKTEIGTAVAKLSSEIKKEGLSVKFIKESLESATDEQSIAVLYSQLVPYIIEEVKLGNLTLEDKASKIKVAGETIYIKDQETLFTLVRLNYINNNFDKDLKYGLNRWQRRFKQLNKEGTNVDAIQGSTKLESGIEIDNYKIIAAYGMMERAGIDTSSIDENSPIMSQYISYVDMFYEDKENELVSMIKLQDKDLQGGELSNVITSVIGEGNRKRVDDFIANINKPGNEFAKNSMSILLAIGGAIAAYKLVFGNNKISLRKNWKKWLGVGAVGVLLNFGYTGFRGRSAVKDGMTALKAQGSIDKREEKAQEKLIDMDDNIDFDNPKETLVKTMTDLLLGSYSLGELENKGIFVDRNGKYEINFEKMEKELKDNNPEKLSVFEMIKNTEGMKSGDYQKIMTDRVNKRTIDKLNKDNVISENRMKTKEDLDIKAAQIAAANQTNSV